VPAPQRDTLRPVAYARRRGAGAPAGEDWTSTWVCVGFAEQLSRPGDLLPATVSRHALHVRRADDGVLRAALNARPFGGCMSIPVQCSGARKIRCPNVACAFSEDPNLVSPHTDEGARVLPQFVGFNPARLVPVRLERWGSLLFVNLSRALVAPLHVSLSRLVAAMGPDRIDSLEAAAIFTQELALGWRAGGPVLAEALAAEAGAGPLRAEPVAAGAPAEAETIPFTRLVPARAPRGPEIACFVVAPHLVIVCLPGRVVAAVLRPVGPGACSLLGAVLRRRDANGDDGSSAIVRRWREVLGTLDARA
jgi:hypothetical protein